jgi:outer membrane protein
MKRIALMIAAYFLLSGILNAQKFAFVDTEYILNNIPAYESAQEQLDQLSIDWQKEIEKVYAEIDKMYKDFQSEKVLLTEEMKKKREDAIIKKEKDAKELQKKYFGKEGSLFKKRQELVKPLQDEIFTAVKEIASNQNFAIIFDTAGGGMSILFADPKYDKSDEVLEKLGFKN